MSVIYLIGSLRNPQIPEIGKYLRSLGFDVYDDWFSAGPDADDCLRDYYRERGFTYPEVMNSYAAQHIFALDFYHLNRAAIGVLVMPAGKSGHLELGYMIGQGKPGFILFDKEPERVDIMHNFSKGIYFDQHSLGQALILKQEKGRL